MILKLLVLVGLSLYLAIQGRWLLAALALFALWPVFGLVIAVILTAILALIGEVWSAVILGALITFNLIGNYYFQRRESYRRIK